jgi:hypothetical protein
LAAEPIDLEDG